MISIPHSETEETCVSFPHCSESLPERVRHGSNSLQSGPSVSSKEGESSFASQVYDLRKHMDLSEGLWLSLQNERDKAAKAFGKTKLSTDCLNTPVFTFFLPFLRLFKSKQTRKKHPLHSRVSLSFYGNVPFPFLLLQQSEALSHPQPPAVRPVWRYCMAHTFVTSHTLSPNLRAGRHPLCGSLS